MLSQATIAELFAAKDSKRKRKGAGKGRAFIRASASDGASSLEQITIKRMGDVDPGKHVGKVGSVRRSRKGASRRLPNGRRYYQHHDYDVNSQEVVAYSLRK